MLDGRSLAARAAPDLARRASAVAARRGRQPRLLLVAWGDDEAPPRYAIRKARACAAAGVEAIPLILAPVVETAAACAAVAERVAAERLDAVFLEYPFPEGIDAGVIVDVVPEDLDVDVMTGGRIARYHDGTGPPPLTVEAGLALLDGYGIDVDGWNGVIVAEDSPFAAMFAEALARRGARMRLLPPSTSTARAAGNARLVIAAAAHPRLLPSRDLADGAVVIDAGYFNPGGVGDVDTSGGIGHLAALAPVPGGIGPMTVSTLVKRVIEFAGHDVHRRNG
jgi:methylenetetrahydrofolate dehydrogenase (NADP+)/methenyltetrahydrofolate cyclohydrolase